VELYELSLRELQDKLNRGDVSPQEIIESLLARIHAVDDRVKAFITLDEENALKKAASLNAKENRTGKMAGLPFALKDLICTRGLRTTCASRMLEDYVPIYDATVVSRLNAEQGILLGKLNMDEFAMGCSTELSAFFPTHNPWDLDRVPGGSSGGCAAAVAAGEVPVALGTDSGGSIRQPASFCGVVGFKPSYGRVSRWGVVAYASSLDQVGVMARQVEDCALVMNTIAGRDPLDSTSADIEVLDYTKFLQPDIKGMKIAYPRECFRPGIDEKVKLLVEEALKKYEEMGAIIEEVSLPHSEYALAAYYIIGPAEASANLACMDGVRFGLRDLEADNVLDMYCNSRSRGFGDEVKKRLMLGTHVLSSGYYDTYYLKAMQVRRLIKNDFDQVFADFDLIMTPTTPTTAFKLGAELGDSLTLYNNDIFTVPVNMAGLPAISIPCGFSDGLPVGLQVIGKAFDEGRVLQAAYAFEQNTPFYKIKPSLGGEQK
jgi:aspartyl-tRNA(Asn)/glutamyl-tRNA(Gln) amidotransferase subunit A